MVMHVHFFILFHILGCSTVKLSENYEKKNEEEVVISSSIYLETVLFNRTGRVGKVKSDSYER